MELSSNWTSEETDITGALQFYMDDLPEALSELLDEDAGFILSRPKLSKEKCFLQLNNHCSSSLKDSSCIGNPLEQIKRSVDPHASERPRIASVTVISESKLVEVFVGKHEEYFGSFPSAIIEQFPDSLICRTVIHLGKPQSSVKLVFKNTFDDSSVMVYGVFAQRAAEGISEEACQTPSFGRFTSNHLDSVLSDHGITNLSKEATMFKQVLQQCYDRGSEGGAAATPSFPFSGFLSLLGASSTAGPAVFSNLAALAQKQYPLSGTGKLETAALSVEERTKSLGSGVELGTTNGSNINSSVFKPAALVTNSGACNGNSVSPSGPFNFLVPGTEVPAAAPRHRKTDDIVCERTLCDDVTRMDISPGNESPHSSSCLSSCGSEAPSPDVLLRGTEPAVGNPVLRGTEPAVGNPVPVGGQTEVNDNAIQSLPKQHGSHLRPADQLLNGNRVQENNNYNGLPSEHLIDLFENIVDKKLAAFEKRIEAMVSQKLSETSAQIFTKLNNIEMSLVGVPDREISGSTI